METSNSLESSFSVLRIGHRFAGLPAGNRLPGHVDFFCQLLLGKPRLVRSSRRISLGSISITTLPEAYHDGNKKQSNWLLPLV